MNCKVRAIRVTRKSAEARPSKMLEDSRDNRYSLKLKNAEI